MTEEEKRRALLNDELVQVILDSKKQNPRAQVLQVLPGNDMRTTT
jgi:hypothetical protein